MSEETFSDDQSHYEISLTAGQAFLAFVLLLLSLAASFAFGLMIGKGQADDRLIVRREPAVIQENGATTKKTSQGQIVELGVQADDFKPQAKAAEAAAAAPASTEVTASASTETPAPVVESTIIAAAPKSEPAKPAPAPAAAHPVAAPAVTHPAGTPVYAQLLTTIDQKTAEALAAKLIERGFTAAYVERGSNDKGPLFRVRVKYATEAEARAAEPKLREISKDVWIVK